MSARYRRMTSSVHICLAVATGFLIVIFYRNQSQRSSSKETLCAREVHRMVLGGLNVQKFTSKNVVYVVHVLVKRSKKIQNNISLYLMLYEEHDRFRTAMSNADCSCGRNTFFSAVAIVKRFSFRKYRSCA